MSFIKFCLPGMHKNRAGGPGFAWRKTFIILFKELLIAQ